VGKKKRTQKPERIIDAHAHVKWYGYDAARLVENMDEHGIDAMWLLTWEVPKQDIEAGLYGSVFWPGRVEMPLEDIMDAVAQFPDRFVPFYAADPTRPGAMQRLAGAVKLNGVRGCGELKSRIMMDDPRALEMFHFCGENGMPVVFHVDVPLPRHQLGRDPGVWYCCDWVNLARALETCPKTVMLGHGPGFWREISGDADSSPEAYPKGPVAPGGVLWKFMDTHPNLYCDLSAGSALYALSRSPEVGKEFLKKYQDRCVFGRDGFDDRMHAFIKSCRFSAAVTRKIMGGNALRLVPLET